MTDAALPVTEQAVERFAEAYLTSLGATIEKKNRRWTISLPEDAATDLDVDGAVLEITTNPDDVSDGALAIAPESPFVERMLDEAADRTPVGSLSLTSNHVELQLPLWLTAGPVTIENRTFTPYYDRRAICALFHVGIETVSEYQQEELRAVALDLNDHDERARLAETYLEVTEDAGREFDEADIPDKQTLVQALDVAHSTIEDRLSPVVSEICERATRAAEVELDEYQEFVHGRRDGIDDEIDRLNTRIEEVTDRIDAASEQDKRVEALRERKELQAELNELRTEFDDLTSQIETDFPEKRREIRDRHALTVRIRPVAATAVSYERGDIELLLRMDEDTVTRSYGYAVGVGVMEDGTCEQCGRELTAENPLAIDGNQTVGAACCDD